MPSQTVTEVTLLVAVCTDGPILLWQAQCIEKLAAVPGVSLDRWLQLPVRRGYEPGSKDSGALSPAPVPDALRAISPDARSTPLPGSVEPADPVDVLLDLSSEGHALPVPWATEVWHFGYGMELSRDPAQASLIDYVRGPGATRVALVSEPAGTVIREGWLRTVSWWVGRPLESMLLDPIDWPAVAAQERLNPDRTAHAVLERRRDRLARVPRSLLQAGAAGRRVQELAEAATRHADWNIGLVRMPIEGIVAAGDDLPVTWLPGRAGHFAADPFGIEREGVLHVLFEDFSRQAGRGFISHVSITGDGVVSDPERVLDPGIHVSYPYLVEHDGGVFMIPETAALGELALYEAVEFPHRWRRAATLLPGIAAVDASMIEHDGRWWMFAGILGRGHNQNLFVWHAPHPAGPWTPHAGNPVKTDARSARSGGTPFVSAGRLYRPSQDNSRRYGGRVVLNRVDVLTPSSFAEQAVGIVGPRRGSPYPHGLHTLSAAGGRTLIDGNMLHFVRGDFQNKVIGRVPGRSSS